MNAEMVPEPIRSIDIDYREEFQQWLDDELDDMTEISDTNGKERQEDVSCESRSCCI